MKNEFPPAIFIHGAIDGVFFVDESIRIHEQLQKVGVRSKLLVAQGVDHGLLELFKGIPQPVPEAPFFDQQVVDFLTREFTA